MLMLPQTQKKEVSSTHRKYKEEVSKTKKIYSKEERRTFSLDYRKRQMKGYNLLWKCVPGTKKVPGKKFSRPDLLMDTVKYIKELENKIKELEKESLKESTSQTPKGMGRDCTDSDLREPLMPHSSPTDLDTGISSPTDLATGLRSLMEAYISEPNSPTDISEMTEPIPVVASTPTGASEEKSSRETSSPIDDHSAILKSLRNKILATPTGASEEESWRETSSPMDVTLQTTSEEIPQWVIVSPEEEELPEFNSVEDLRQWLGL
jgi:hypothetical protein